MSLTIDRLIDRLVMAGDAMGRLRIARALIDDSCQELIGEDPKNKHLQDEIQKAIHKLIDIGINKKIALSKNIKGRITK